MSGKPRRGDAPGLPGEHGVTYLALRHTVLQGRVLRSGDAAGLEREMWALLALYQLRIAVTGAIETMPGTDPDRASYQIAAETAQVLVTGARTIACEPCDLSGDIGRAVLANLNPARRPRVCPAGSGPRSAAGASTRPASPRPARRA